MDTPPATQVGAENGDGNLFKLPVKGGIIAKAELIGGVGTFGKCAAVPFGLRQERFPVVA